MGLSQEEIHQHAKDRPIPADTSEEIQKNIGRMPDRQIFDFLVQYYVTEVHWFVTISLEPQSH